MRKVGFHSEAFEQFTDWAKQDSQVFERLTRLIKDTLREQLAEGKDGKFFCEKAVDLMPYPYNLQLMRHALGKIAGAFRRAHDSLVGADARRRFRLPGPRHRLAPPRSDVGGRPRWTTACLP